MKNPLARACARLHVANTTCLRQGFIPSRKLYGQLEQKASISSSHSPQWHQTRELAAPVTTPVGRDKKERIVILGSGWAGYVLSQRLDPRKFEILIVSPRSYFVFTPLLNDSAVGTLEFRNVLESIRKRKSHVEFLQGWADDVNFADKTVTVEPSVLDQNVGTAMVGGPSSAAEQEESRKASEDRGKAVFQMGGTGTVGGTGQQEVPTFPISYDKLVIAVGCYSQTFNTPGVKENALFLKDVNDARRIRRRILDLFELAKLPFLPEATKRHLLHFAVVGGGPTGIEFAACLSDLARDDLSKIHPDLMQYVRISLYDVAPKVLPMFDASLSDYAVKQYQRKNVEIKTSHHVVCLRKGFPNDAEARNNQDGQVKHRVYTLETKEEGDVGVGMCVWSTGNMQNPFVQKALNHVRRFPSDSADIVKGEVSDPMRRQWQIQRDPKTGLILVDDHFRLHLETEKGTFNQTESQDSTTSTDIPAAEATMNNVFALGDTTILTSGRLPGTAQVANQQALWLAKTLNNSTPIPSSSLSSPPPSAFSGVPGFGFKDLGVMTYLGGSRAILQTPNTSADGTRKGIKGWVAYLIWRGAYLSMTLSWRNRFLVAVQWVAVRVFGRDVSRF